MRHRNSGSSLKLRRSLCLEPLEDRCVPAIAGLLDSSGLSSLLPQVTAVVAPAPLLPIVNQVEKGTVGTAASATPGQASQTDLLTDLLKTDGSGSAGASTSGDKAGKPDAGKGSIVSSIVPDTTSTVSGVGNVLHGLSQTPGNQSPSTSPADPGSGSEDPVDGTGAGSVLDVVLIDVTGPDIIDGGSAAKGGTPSASGPVLGMGSALAASPVLTGFTGNAVIAGILSNGSPPQGPGASNGNGLSPNQNLFTGSSLVFSQGAPDAAGNLGSSALPGSTFLPGQSSPFALFGNAPSGSLFGADGRIAAEAGWAKPVAGTLREYRAAIAQNAEVLPPLDEEEPGLPGLAPVSADLLQASDDLGALDRAFIDFLEGVGDLRQTLSGWLVQLGPTPWISMGLAVTLAVCGEVARRRRSSRSRDMEQPLDSVPFAALADA